ncbi:Acetyl esterase/lipase [Chryseobacterium soldanellicola]|uniref:Acetyl esterase/lipase n=1 Tax=Chryseobacterium soldanellicola TaxID=311333 RepID=A0A1H0XM71_9FLAO|nr:alpha/beta hydrolase [Chryseobacterium soldanellicola]SDQ04015.1 Acetyl esterase/lipase [Chryseobacterium soldanellicola]
MINLTEGRKGFETISNYSISEKVTLENIIIADVPCAWVIPDEIVGNDIVIYIHGGAFIYGSINSHAPMVSYIASQLKKKVLMIDYRLAPEYPFPAGIDDCVAVINFLHKNNSNFSFGIIADSAGGNIAMSTNLQLNETNGPKPMYTVVISPWVDLECKNPSYERNQLTDTILAKEYLIEATKLYAPDQDLSAPFLSPVHGSFKNQSPILILCGTNEILEDDSINLHQQLLNQNIEAELILFENELHVWPFMEIDTEASKKALLRIADFVEKYSV